MSDPLTVVSVTPLPLGADSRTLKQAMTLARHGYRSIVLADRQRWELHCDESIRLDTGRTSEESVSPVGEVRSRWRQFRRANIHRIIQVPLFCCWLVLFAYRYIWQVLVRLPPASLYCVHERQSFPAVWLRSRLSKTPIVYDAHDFYSEMEVDAEKTSFNRRFLSPFLLWIERSCINHSSRVFTVSEGVASLLNKRFGAKAVVVRNCHDRRLDRSATQDVRAMFGLQKNDFLLVTIGNCKKGQLICSALEALLQLPPHVHLAFVGGGYGVYKRAIREYSLGARVHLVGFLPPNELVPSVRSADASLILYYPRSVNYQAALPNKLFQSLAAELPVLYPELPEIAAIMRSGGCGICIDPQQPKSIANAVRRLLADRDAAGTSGQRSEMKSQYSWELEERIFMSHIVQVMAHSDTYRKPASVSRS